MAKVTPIQSKLPDLRNPEVSDNSNGLTDQQLNSLRSSVKLMALRTASLVDVLKGDNASTKKDVSRINILNRRLKRVIPIIPRMGESAAAAAGAFAAGTIGNDMLGLGSLLWEGGFPQPYVGPGPGPGLKPRPTGSNKIVPRRTNQIVPKVTTSTPLRTIFDSPRLSQPRHPYLRGSGQTNLLRGSRQTNLLRGTTPKNITPLRQRIANAFNLRTSRTAITNSWNRLLNVFKKTEIPVSQRVIPVEPIISGTNTNATRVPNQVVEEVVEEVVTPTNIGRRANTTNPKLNLKNFFSGGRIRTASGGLLKAILLGFLIDQSYLGIDYRMHIEPALNNAEKLAEAASNGDEKAQRILEEYIGARFEEMIREVHYTENDWRHGLQSFGQFFAGMTGDRGYTNAQEKISINSRILTGLEERGIDVGGILLRNGMINEDGQVNSDWKDEVTSQDTEPTDIRYSPEGTIRDFWRYLETVDPDSDVSSLRLDTSSNTNIVYVITDQVPV